MVQIQVDGSFNSFSRWPMLETWRASGRKKKKKEKKEEKKEPAKEAGGREGWEMYSPAGRASGDFDAATVNLDFKSHLAHLWCICLSFGGSKQRSRAPLHLREKMYAGWHNFSMARDWSPDTTVSNLQKFVNRDPRWIFHKKVKEKEKNYRCIVSTRSSVSYLMLGRSNVEMKEGSGGGKEA